MQPSTAAERSALEVTSGGVPPTGHVSDGWVPVGLINGGQGGRYHMSTYGRRRWQVRRRRRSADGILGKVASLPYQTLVSIDDLKLRSQSASRWKRPCATSTKCWWRV